jgi:putative hydrolase of the HAD superfamily
VRQGLTLIFDGDDTLWENNVYFERAIEEFITFLDHSSLSRAEVRAVLDEIEHANVASYGYGARSFARSLRDCFERLGEREGREEDLATVAELGERILRQPIELIDGVEETLAFLAPRHRLLLLTKGHAEEQRLKDH